MNSKDKCNLLIPMAGTGSRFKNYSDLPKPLIPVLGEPMILQVIKNLYHKNLRFIFCINNQIIQKYKIDQTILAILPDAAIIPINYITRGPAATCSLADKYIDNKIPLIISNADQMVHDWDYEEFKEFCNCGDYDGVVGTFASDSPKNSYVELDDTMLAKRFKEKEVISPYATNGIHYWKHGEDFISSFNQMESEENTVNGEFYVSETYNYLIQQGKKIAIYPFRYHFPIGIPEDLDYYHSVYGQKL